MNTIIIEDERPAMELLVQLLTEVEPGINIIAILSSVKEAKQYFEAGGTADIIFSDVQLGDGYSFEIFKQYPPASPVVFATGYDDFMLNAFACNGIDYLLKPLHKADLQQAISKYKALQQHFSSGNPLQKFLTHIEQKKKTRLIVRKGLEYLALKLDDIVLLYTENKLVYVIDKYGKKYVGEKTLGEMELELDDRVFFRANRQYIININFIKGFKSFEKVKLLVELSLPELQHQIVVSQENAPNFRQWIHEA